MKFQKLDKTFSNQLFHLYNKQLENKKSKSEVERLFSQKANFFGIIDNNSTLIGAIRVIDSTFSRLAEFWDLCAINGEKKTDLLKKLIENAEKTLDLSHIDFIRAITLKGSLYSELFRQHGYLVERRILQIEWDLNENIPAISTTKEINIKSGIHYQGEKLSELLVESIKPQWEWWIKDNGGNHSLRLRMDKMFQNNEERKNWLVAEKEDKLIGLTGFHKLNKEIASFAGVMVIPDYRMKGIGRMLLSEILKLCQKHYFEKLQVFTVSPLDNLAPGALLYLRHGGKLIREFVHLEKKI